MKSTASFLLAGAVLAVAGYAAVWLPWQLAGAHRNLIDGMRPASLFYLVLVGIAGRLLGQLRCRFVALASVAAFPVLALLEAVRQPDTHNLLGLELVMYGFLALPAFVGALLAKGIDRWLTRNRRPKN